VGIDKRVIILASGDPKAHYMETLAAIQRAHAAGELVVLSYPPSMARELPPPFTEVEAVAKALCPLPKLSDGRQRNPGAKAAAREERWRLRRLAQMEKRRKH
jgi:hypothetical protein